MTTSGAHEEKGLLNPCPDCKSTDKRIRYEMRRCGKCNADLPTPPCPTCTQQRDIAQKALSDLLDRDFKIQELTLALNQANAELKGFREKEVPNV